MPFRFARLLGYILCTVTMFFSTLAVSKPLLSKGLDGHQIAEEIQPTTSPLSATQKNAALTSHSNTNLFEKIAGFTFGVIFISILLAVSLVKPELTLHQEQIIRIVLALAAAGVGGVLAGFIQVEGKFEKIAVHAGGALALFIIVYFFTPKSAGGTAKKKTMN